MDINNMRFKTLVINKGTKNQEFFGCRDDWYTSSSPINLMPTSLTFEEYKEWIEGEEWLEIIPKEHWNGVDMVTVEIKIVEGE